MRQLNFTLLKSLMWCVCLASASFTATVSAAVEVKTQHFDIPGQELSTALEQFAVQSDLEILFAPEDAAAKRTQGVRGEYVSTEALTILLSGTGLRYRVTNADSIIVEGAQSRATSGASAATDGKSVRLAQTATTAATVSAENARTEAEERREIDVDLGEVIVTGTHIRGVEIAGSNLIVIDRNYIDKSGYATVQDIVRTLPQNFSGGVNEILGTTDFGAANVNYGSAVNLRGLGPGATLVLINGHRAVSGGFAGAFVDVSNIPSSAIERIEVLSDGASAVYGSEAVSGVINFILREDYDGAETRARFGTLDGDADEVLASQLLGNDWNGGNVLLGYQYYERDTLLLTDRPYSADTDQRPRGGDNFSSANSNPGNIFDLNGQPAFAIPAGQDGTALTVGDLQSGVVNFQNQAEQDALLPKQEMHSVFLDGSQDMGERVHLFAQGRYNARDVTSMGGGAG